MGLELPLLINTFLIKDILDNRQKLQTSNYEEVIYSLLVFIVFAVIYSLLYID